MTVDTQQQDFMLQQVFVRGQVHTASHTLPLLHPCMRQSLSIFALKQKYSLHL